MRPPPAWRRYLRFFGSDVDADVDPAALARAARRLVAALDPELVTYDVRTMREDLDGGLAFLFLRLAATLASAVALLGLIQAVGHGLRLTTIGLALGAGVAALAARALSAALSGLGGIDPLAAAGAALALALCATVASVIPAWCALRVDVVRSLSS